ncbi:MAG: tRNA (adenosine(37)-N6)-threonylcarbamoyltransferase complex dimerization subunit type 1 TsaB [Buchnera aphidicola (Melaphis rhois)]
MNTSKTILAFDASISDCSVSLLYKSNVYNKNKKCDKNQTQYILPMIKTMLNVNSVNLSEINILTISKGPGSFVGIRTTIAIAQGLALGLSIPIFALSTSRIIAEYAWNTFKLNKILVVLKINKNKIYLAKYTKNTRQNWIKKQYEGMCTIEEITKILSSLKKNWIIIGNVLELFSKNILKKNLILKNISSLKSQFIISLYLSSTHYQKHKSYFDISPIYFPKEVNS